MPWVQCNSPSDQYCIQTLIEATTILTPVVYDRLLYSRALIAWFFLTLLRASRCPTHPYTCLTLFLSHPLMVTTLIQKPKDSMPQPRKHHLSLENPMMSIGHTMRSFPHTSGGNLLTQKIPQWALHDLHHQKTYISLPSLDPTPLQRLKNMKRA